jgi:hypothetical protein
MKQIILLFILGLSGLVHSQNRLSVNAATTLLGFPSLGYEKPLNPHFSFHLDAIGSPLNSYNDMPLRFLIITPEVRYYPSKDHRGFYAGAHIGGSTFKLQKYGYEDTTYYQKGYNYMMGASFGYVYFVSEKIALEAFIGGGSIQSFYKGYDTTTGERYDGAEKFNKSGEWLPYRGGISIIFQLK